MSESVKTKQCTKCEEWLPLTTDYFHRWSRSSDGFKPRCKKCRSQRPGGYLAPARDGFKRCTKCRNEFPSTLEFFQRIATRKDGLSAHCKNCTWSKRNPEQRRVIWKRWAENNPEAAREAVQKYKERHPEQAAKDNKKGAAKKAERRRSDPQYAAETREKQRRFFQENKTRLMQLSKAYARKHPEKRRQYNRNWYAARRHVAIATVQRRHARKRGLPNNFSAEQWQHALDYFGGCCAVCERPMNGLFHAPNADHWIPLSDPNCPGTVPSNMIPLCGGVDGCNQSKRNREAAEWLVSKFGKRRAASILARIEAYFASLGT